MENWLIWRIDCGKSANGKKAYGETTSYPLSKFPELYFVVFPEMSV